MAVLEEYYSSICYSTVSIASFARAMTATFATGSFNFAVAAAILTDSN